MSFAEHITAVIARGSFPQLHELSREVWRALFAGVISDDEAHAASLAIEERRRSTAGGSSELPRRSLSVPEAPNAAFSDRQASIDRRRRLAARPLRRRGMPPL
jgi:hypothetical protein